jgi:hypothetical protein
MVLVLNENFINWPTEFESVDEFIRGFEDFYDWRPNLVRREDLYEIRVYRDDSGLSVYDGHPHFRRDEWLARGANWEPVAEAIKD